MNNRERVGRWFCQAKNHLHIAFGTVVVFMSITAALAAGETIKEGFSFAIYELFFLMIPGYVIATIAFRSVKNMERLLMSFVLGYIVNAIVYVVALKLGIDGYLRILYVIVCMVFIIIAIITRHRVEYFDCSSCTVDETCIFCCLAACIFVAKLICFSMNMLPPIHGGTYFNNDFLHWTADVASAKLSFPVGNIRMMGADYHYHYFAFVQQAAISKTIDISAIQTTAIFSYVQTTILLSLSMICVIRRLVSDGAMILLTAIISVFATGLENKTIVTYRFHMILQPMAFDLGVGFFLASISSWFGIINRKGTSIGYAVYMFLLFFLITGVKAPCGAVAILFAWIVCIYLIRKKRYEGLLYGAVITAGFVLAYYLFMTSAVSDYSTSIRTMEVSNLQQSGGGVLNYLRVGVLIDFLKYIWMLNPICLTTIIIVGLVSISKKRLSKWHVFFFLILMLASGLSFFVKMSGSSEMYFAMTAIPLIGIMFGNAVETLKQLIRSRNIVFFYCTVCAFIMTGIFAATDYHEQTAGFSARGMRVLQDRSFEITESRPELLDVYISEAEYEAYIWIRNNTREDAVFLVDDVFEGQSINAFSALAERMTYWTRDEAEKDEIRLAFMGDMSTCQNQLHKADYFVIHNRKMDVFFWDRAWGDMMYKNDDITVYKVRATDGIPDEL